MPYRHLPKLKALLPVGLLLLVNIAIQPLYAQGGSLQPWTEVVVYEGTDTLAYGFAGGLNNPQFYQADFTGNGTDDLMVFDRQGGRVLLFGWSGTDWEWLATPPVDFPDMEHWAVPFDYNCDNVPDLITAGKFGYTRLLRGYRDQGRLKFKTVQDTVRYAYPQGTFHLGVDLIDVPGIADVNGDGDMDILNFSVSGGFLLYFENQSIEEHGICDTIILKLESECWGEFYETGINKTVLLDTCPPESVFGGGEPGLRHAGSTVAPLDVNDDQLMDVILGDLNFSNLNLLINGGTQQVAEVNAQDTAFPKNDVPADLDVFPGAYVVDTDMDGRQDVVAAPNFLNGSFNRNHVWRYVDQAATGAAQFARQEMDWLIGEMVDAGGHGAPAMMDVDGDGLLDIILGGGTIREPGGVQNGGLVLLKNVGTPSLPAFEILDTDFGGVRAFGLDDITPAVGDMDDDGDLDILIGENTGKLHLLRNTGQPGGPAQFTSFTPLYMDIDIGSNSTPCLVDLNGDGLLDLIVGEKNGNLNYFENTGTKQQAQFSDVPDNDFLGEVDARNPGQLFGHSAPAIWRDSSGQLDLLVGSINGVVHYYPDIEGMTSAPFVAKTEKLGGLDVGGYATPWAADLNSDGNLDLLVGTSRGGVELFKGDQNVGITTVVSLPQLEVYPNPADSRLTIQSDWSGAYKIHTIQGQVMTQGVLEPGQSKTLYLRDWPSGIYLLSFVHNHTVISQKLVICH